MEPDKPICHIHQSPFSVYCSDCLRPLCSCCVTNCSTHDLVTAKDLVEREFALREEDVFILTKQEQEMVSNHGETAVNELEEKITKLKAKGSEMGDSSHLRDKVAKLEGILSMIMYVRSNTSKEFRCSESQDMLALFVTMMRCNITPRPTSCQNSFSSFYGASLIPFVRKGCEEHNKGCDIVAGGKTFAISSSGETGIDIVGIEGVTSCMSDSGHFLCFDSSRRALHIVELLDKAKGCVEDAPKTVAVVSGFSSYTLIGSWNKWVITITQGESTVRYCSISDIIEVYRDGGEPLERFNTVELTSLCPETSNDELVCASSAGKVDTCQHDGILQYRSKFGSLLSICVSKAGVNDIKLSVKVNRVHKFNWVVNGTGLLVPSCNVTYYDDSKRCGVVAPAVTKEGTGKEMVNVVYTPRCICQSIGKGLYVQGCGVLWSSEDKDANQTLEMLSPMSSYHPLVRVWRNIFLSYSSGKGRWLYVMIDLLNTTE